MGAGLRASAKVRIPVYLRIESGYSRSNFWPLSIREIKAYLTVCHTNLLSFGKAFHSKIMVSFTDINSLIET